jgi:ATP-dependent RNA helicase DeaD
VDEYHGDLSQSQRERLLARFKGGQVRWVVATDIAARGLDVDHLTHVINYDLPDQVESYIHRIGRTLESHSGSNPIAN